MRFFPADGRLSLRVTLLTLAGTVLPAAAAVLAYALAAARVPEQRAALEQLLRAETGLEVRFSELALRWGWYGPEAVFRGVQLGESGEARTLLTAPQLVVSVDLWRMLRSGELQIARITLIDPDIDLTAPAARGTVRWPPAAVRGLGRGPRVAALWLSLRELLSGNGRERAALRLRGTWNAPMVTEP